MADIKDVMEIKKEKDIDGNALFIMDGIVEYKEFVKQPEVIEIDSENDLNESLTSVTPSCDNSQRSITEDSSSCSDFSLSDEDISIAPVTNHDSNQTHTENVFTNFLQRRKFRSNDLKCRFCDFTGSDKMDLRSHLTHHTEFMKYRCSLCDKQFSHERSLLSHEKTHHNQENIPKSSTSETFLQAEHERRVKSTGSGSVFDVKCDDSKELDSYFRNDSRKFECHKCNYSTHRYIDLIQHTSIHGDEVYECSKCDYKSNVKRNLRRHEIIHGGSDEVYKCSKCDYKSTVKRNFKRHELIHGDSDEVYECTKCDYKSTVKRNFKRHEMKHRGKKDGAMTVSLEQ